MCALLQEIGWETFFLYQAVNMFISTVKTAFFGLGVFVVSRTLGATLKGALDKLHISALSHCLVFFDQRLLLHVSTTVSL